MVCLGPTWTVEEKFNFCSVAFCQWTLSPSISYSNTYLLNIHLKYLIRILCQTVVALLTQNGTRDAVYIDK